MKLIFDDFYLPDFNFWGGAKENASELTRDQLETLQFILSDIYPDGVDATTLNDLMWFEFDTIKEWLGIEDDE